MTRINKKRDKDEREIAVARVSTFKCCEFCFYAIANRDVEMETKYGCHLTKHLPACRVANCNFNDLLMTIYNI